TGPTTSYLLSLSFTQPSPSASYPLSLHDALPISSATAAPGSTATTPTPVSIRRTRGTSARTATTAIPTSIRTASATTTTTSGRRSEEHTSELQSRFDLVCRLLLEKKNKKKKNHQP